MLIYTVGIVSHQGHCFLYYCDLWKPVVGEKITYLSNSLILLKIFHAFDHHGVKVKLPTKTIKPQKFPPKTYKYIHPVCSYVYNYEAIVVFTKHARTD